MKKVDAFLAVLLLLASACTTTASPDATVTPEPTAMLTATPTIAPTATNTPTPEPTATPTITPTPEPTSTPTETPTPTPFPASSFSIQVIGYGEHGAMLELLYDGELSDLDPTAIYVTTFQEASRREMQSFEVLEGRYLAEITDAMYDLGEIEVVLDIRLYDNVGENTSIPLNTELEQYYPWMHYYYGESCLAARTNLPSPSHPEAYDLQPTSNEFPDGLEHPVYSPCVGEVYQSSTLSRDGGVDYHNMWLYCIYTGFYVQIGHMYPQLTVGESVDPETIVGYLSGETGWPHNHTTVRKPTTAPRRSQITDNSTFVDLFSPNMQLGGPVLPYGFWLDESLPQCAIDVIEQGRFLP